MFSEFFDLVAIKYFQAAVQKGTAYWPNSFYLYLSFFYKFFWSQTKHVLKVLPTNSFSIGWKVTTFPPQPVKIAIHAYECVFQSVNEGCVYF